MFCPKCGEQLPDDSEFCVKCGTKLKNDNDSDSQETPKKVNDKNKKLIKIIAISVLAVVVIVFGFNAVQSANLKKELMRDWSRIEGDDGAYIECILDFSENEIEYRLETGYSWMDTTVDTYDYKVISGNKIKVQMFGDDWETVTVEFDDEKKMMTVKPGLTSVDDEETWFNFD